MDFRWLLVVSLLAGCQGEFSIGGAGKSGAEGKGGDAQSGDASTPGPASVPRPGTEVIEETAEIESFGEAGLRRLTQAELINSVEAVFAIDPAPYRAELPTDVSSTRFDNGYEAQALSSLEVNEFLAFAEQYASAVANDGAVTERLGGCTSSGADDTACLTSFAQAIGTHLFRRPVDDVAALVDGVAPFMAEDSDFATGVELVTTYFLVHPEFLYRTETEAGLTQHEIATRLAFFVWGQGPDTELIAAADRGELGEPLARAAHVQRLLDEPQARDHWARFHAMWLGYETNHLEPTLADDMVAETSKLVLDVMYQSDWMDILRADETWVSPELASYYGLDVPSDTGWVGYQGMRGGGVLSHATVLNHGYKGGAFQDTSPTLRGYELFKRLTCGVVGEAPGSVDPDRPPGNATDCKADAYTMRDNPECASCHIVTDGLGFGLENFDENGVFRTHEPTGGGCEISGEGEFRGQAFTGPAELGELLAEDPAVRQCANKHLFRYLTGREDGPDDLDTVEAMTSVQSSVQTLSETIVQIVASDAFIQQ